jgi:cupin fold WbuC family metalloprotein
MKFDEHNEEVLYFSGELLLISSKEIDFFKAKALQSKRKTLRLCVHKNPDEAVHEMLIVHSREYCVRPHRHIGKEESIYAIEGEFNLLIYDERGKVEKRIQMGDIKSGKIFYFKLTGSKFHSFEILSEIIVFKEVCQGPFSPSNTIFPSWA